MTREDIQLYVVYRVVFKQPISLRLTTSKGERTQEAELVFFETTTNDFCYRVPNGVYGFMVNDLLEKVDRLEVIGEEQASAV